MDKVVERLKDEREYYGELGRKYLSNSDIGTLLSNPADFMKPREDNKSLSDGRYFHQLILEPERAIQTPYVDVSSRNTKEYKMYCEDRNLPFVMLKKEMEEIEWCVKKMLSNIVFYDEIYREGNKFEEPNLAMIHGVMWKGRADIVTDEMIIDLKTTSDINKFKYSAKAYNYDSQCFIYQTLFGKPLVFYVVDKGTGQLGIFKPTDSFVSGGEEKVIKAVEVYKKYFSDTPTDSINNYFIDDILT